MTELTIQDLIANAQKSMNEIENQKYTNIVADVLESFAELKCFNDEQIMNGLANLSRDEVDTIKGQGIRLLKLLNISHNIYRGRRVEKGVIAGTRVIDGHKEALVAGPDFYEWQRVEKIKF